MSKVKFTDDELYEMAGQGAAFLPVTEDQSKRIATGDLKLPEAKPSNPKDLIGTDKVPLSLVPATSIAYQALGHLEGHLKYGKVNWREAGVKFSIYLDACLRHLKKLEDGEWADPQTKVPHLGNALASLGIIVDAYECGKLIDDRPKQGAGAATIDRLAGVVKHLRTIFGDKNPKHFYHEGPIDE